VSAEGIVVATPKSAMQALCDAVISMLSWSSVGGQSKCQQVLDSQPPTHSFEVPMDDSLAMQILKTLSNIIVLQKIRRITTLYNHGGRLISCSPIVRNQCPKWNLPRSLLGCRYPSRDTLSKACVDQTHPYDKHHRRVGHLDARVAST
jgi:hypothetical protein